MNSPASSNYEQHPPQEPDHQDIDALKIKYTKHKFKADKFTQPPSMKNDGIPAYEAFFKICFASYTPSSILISLVIITDIITWCPLG